MRVLRPMIHRTSSLLLLGLLGLALSAAPALAQDNAYVDRVSQRIAGALGVEDDSPTLRPIVPASDHPQRMTIVGARMAGPANGVRQITLDVTLPGEGPRLLLVDAGAIWRGPKGADFVLVPNQKFIIDKPKMSVTAEALAVNPRPAPVAPGTPLSAIWSNDPGLIAVLRTVQTIEAEEAKSLTRYLKEKDGVWAVDTFLDNQDVRLAKRLTWSKNVLDVLEGRIDRAEIQLAIFAVTADYQLAQAADWMMLNRSLDSKAGVDAAWAATPGVEYLLERATLNHRVFSPRHATYYFNIGVKAYERNDLPAARKSFEKALTMRPEFLDAKYNLGVVLYRMGKYNDARGEFSIASGMDGADAQVHYNKGATLYRLDEKLGAARAFRAALAVNPKLEVAERWLEKADPEGKTKPKKKKKKKRRRRRRRRK